MLSESLENVVGDVLIAAAFIAYLGAFTVDYRQVFLAYFSHILISNSKTSLAQRFGFYSTLLCDPYLPLYFHLKFFFWLIYFC